MATQILRTKLYPPRAGADLIQRPQLIARLNAGLWDQRGLFGRKLSLISAPAGFGKTRLIAAWAQEQNAPVAWLSLDKSDDDLRRFLTYLVAAIQQVLADYGSELLRLLQVPEQEIAWEPVLVAALNELAAVGQPIIVVLDDVHHLQSAAIQQGLAFWLDHQPPNLHLAITSRTEPALPLSRLRAQGQLREIDLKALRFTPEETERFFSELTDLQLSQGEATRLAERTEGWPAGLRLAAVAMQSALGSEEADPAGFIASFSGSNRLVLDYLADEVLAQQPEATRDFLLRTALLDRFCAPLCEAVLAGGDEHRGEAVSSQAMLERLEADNLFILPLDQERRWYRYHTLFADLLRDRLQRTYPDEIPLLHGRASRWWAANGFVPEAIDHALAAGDEGAAAQLVADQAQEMIWRGEMMTLAGWLEALPGTAVEANPRLNLSLAFTRLLAGHFSSLADILSPLERVEGQLQGGNSPEKEKLLAEINTLRAVVLVELGETEPGLTLAESVAGELASDRSPYGLYLMALLGATMGLAYRDQGRTEAAVQAYAAASKNRDSILIALLAAYERGKLHQEMGQLNQAEGVHREAIDWVTAQFGAGAAALPLSGAAHIGLGRALYERNRLDEACQHLETGIERASQRGGLGIDRDGLLTLALVKQDQNEGEEANSLMSQAVEHAELSPRPDARLRADAHRIRLWLKQDNLSAARDWAERQAINLGEPAYPAEITAVSLARIHLAQQRPEKALAILGPFEAVVEAGGRRGRSLEIWLLQVLAHQQLEETGVALAYLKRCLAMAAPEGYVRPFLDGGRPLAGLLYRAVQAGIMAEYGGELLALLAVEEAPGAVDSPHQADTPTQIEPLSERELEVLQLVASGLSNREIGLRLYLSPNTVKRHTLNIYEKLGVHSRTEAVAKSRKLGILA